MQRASVWFKDRTGYELKHALVAGGWTTFAGYHLNNCRTTVPANAEKCEQILHKVQTGSSWPKDLRVSDRQSSFIVPAKKTTFLSAKQDGREYAAGTRISLLDVDPTRRWWVRRGTV